MKKRIILLGSTGSIGENALRVARSLPDRVEIVGLAAGSNHELLWRQYQEFRPQAVALYDLQAAHALAKLLPREVPCLAGPEGLCHLVETLEADLVLVAIVGTAGLRPTLAAIRTGKDIALASKEVLVMAGAIVTAALHKYGRRLLPVDSEHNAIFQCLEGRNREELRRIILTASGGPFRSTPKEALAHVTQTEALTHPTWKMGRKITVDSATLFNKGLEVIEAHWLFGVGIDQIEVVIHPQSIVHSLVEWVDGSVLAQLSVSDMRLPIQYALTYPDRLPTEVAPLNLVQVGSLTFEAPDPERFPALELARQAARSGGTFPCVLNAANEVAVQSFLQGSLSFADIPRCVQEVMEQHRAVAHPCLEEILEVDRWARAQAEKWVKERAILVREPKK
ncbi:1-deoxy-D-xylulose-5-phosphate reductoisomerase [Candidatus Methylacidithermus pantelleriae]|uniref:1-deoxy-D-xylulose 5-phosphate reductoisomerase n=1 Tax=Candidatus Methylacidithermus pantelleriae TaxID=2744239 RepID=A0A8J2BJZ4_9BACT|nr:1-deoxy-D-xylulose-5-phosphate reductoisomerase [Candidatus Methylacidithermus pantelleriae]CAF0688985.1 1-deoxy-D-xylulose 5-phosphate reductoisomerase [Candidatus Methylacidithermus pantelleriae]